MIHPQFMNKLIGIIFLRLGWLAALAAILLAGCQHWQVLTPETAWKAPALATLTRAASPAASLTLLLPTATPVKTATPALSPSPSRTPAPFKPSLTPTPDCLQQGGRIEVGRFPTELLRLAMDYRVYLPPCYDELPARRYPVLFLLHGQSYTDDQWDRLGADETADRLIAAGELPPFLIVMPRDRYGGQPTENNYARVIVEELIPYLDENYRTLPDREHRAVGGLSRGAGWAVHLAIVHWEVFGALGAHSAAIFHTDAQSMRTWLAAIPAEQAPRIFLDIGDRDRPEIMDSAQWFENLLNEKDIPHEWYLFSGFHSETYWSAHVEQYLRWYARDW